MPLSEHERSFRVALSRGPGAVDAWLAKALAAEDVERERKAEAEAAERRAEHAKRMRAWRWENDSRRYNDAPGRPQSNRPALLHAVDSG